jgi:hypothetical protein
MAEPKPRTRVSKSISAASDVDDTDEFLTRRASLRQTITGLMAKTTSDEIPSGGLLRQSRSFSSTFARPEGPLDSNPAYGDVKPQDATPSTDGKLNAEEGTKPVLDAYPSKKSKATTSGGSLSLLSQGPALQTAMTVNTTDPGISESNTGTFLPRSQCIQHVKL